MSRAQFARQKITNKPWFGEIGYEQKSHSPILFFIWIELMYGYEQRPIATSLQDQRKDYYCPELTIKDFSQ